ncbi:hypothetical protein IJ103_03895 [Candidatus Saccharibacteria bacterium]|nr:hypothetical protein [Candidatus Saccharibacteria bacterium]
MKKLKSLLKSPALALGLTPALFALSQLVILGYYWLANGYAGNLTLTISRYVGLELWTSILFAIFNLAIIIIMLRYYFSLKNSRSPLWLIFGLLQVLGFALLSIFPHNSFMSGDARTVIVNLHEFSARLMFISMFAMAFETLRLSHPNHLKFLQKFKLFQTKSSPSLPAATTKVSVFFIIYGLVYLFAYSTKLPLIWDRVLILETGYIYAFMAFLLLTRKIKKKDLAPKPSA